MLSRAGRFSTNQLPVAFYLAGAGIAYVLGYGIQDLFSVLRIVRTAPIFHPWCVLQGAYRWFVHRPWVNVEPFDPVEATIRISARPEREAAHLERVVSLMQVGTTGGPSGLISGGLLMWRAVKTGATYDWALGWGAIIFGVVLIGLGWVKAAQQTQYMRILLDR